MDSIELRLFPGESATWTIQDPFIELDTSAEIHITHFSHPQLRSQIFLSMNNNPSQPLSSWQDDPPVLGVDSLDQPLEFTLSIAPSLDERWHDQLLTFDLELVHIIQENRLTQQEEVVGVQDTQSVVDTSMKQVLLRSIMIVIAIVGVLMVYWWKRTVFRSMRKQTNDDSF